MDLIKLTPHEITVKLSGMNTAIKCIESDNASLAIIKKEIGMKKLSVHVQIWIADLNDFLNVSRKMDLKQIEETALMILTDFYYMNIADINLVFTRAKKGHFGELYQSIDGMKIYSWFDKYATERAQTAYDKQINEHAKIKERRN